MLKDKLLVRPFPKQDESIIGYLLRVSEANGYDSINWLLQEFKLRRTNARHSYVYGTTDLKRMARALNVDESVLGQMTFKPIEVSLRLIGSYKVFGRNVPSFIIRPNNPKVCPACLAEDGYCRKAWEIAVLTACPKHRCMLLQECPNCKSTIKWNRAKVCGCDCGYDWREFQPQRLLDAEIRLVNRFYELLRLGEFKTAPAKKIPEPLRNFEFTDLLNVLFSVTAQQRGRCDIAGKTLCKLPNAELHNELILAVGIFENFPLNFFAFLDSLKKVYSPKIREDNPKANHLTTRRQTIFGGIIRTVTGGLKGRQFDFLREAFDEYYAHEKIANVGIELKREDMRAAEFLNTHASLSEARKTLKTTFVVIKAIIGAGGMRAVTGHGSDGSEFWFINKSDLANVKERLKDCISAIEIQRILGVQNHHVDYLIREGFLTEIPDLRIAPVFARVFSRRQAEGVYRTFEKAAARRSKKRQALSADDRLSSSRTAFLLGRLGIDFGELTRLVHARVIAPIGTAGGNKKGLLNFEYDKAEIEIFCEKRLAELKVGTLSVIEAARELSVDRELIKSLIKRNILQTVERDKAHFLKVRISRESVDEFLNNYVLSNVLATERRTMPKSINQILAELKIVPVDSSSGTHCYVYRKQDIKGISFSKTDARPNTPVFTAQETAAELGPELEQLLTLVKNGVLMPYHRTENRMKKYPVFTRAGIENFRKLGLKSLNVVSRGAAAGIMGIGITAFKARYVKTNRLKPVKLSGEGKRILYSLEDVENLRAAEAEGVRAGEAAEILGANISCVNKLTVSGHLNPVSGPNIDGFQYNVYRRSEVEALHSQRQAFKFDQIKAGKSARFGRVSGNRYSRRKTYESLKNTRE